MKTTYHLTTELGECLNKYSNFVQSLIDSGEINDIRPHGSKFYKEGRAEYAASKECLMSMNHKREVGYPPDSRGIDFLQDKAFKAVEHGDMPFDLYKKIKDAGDELDDWMDRNVGFRNPALKMYYPEDGYIAWHHNGNANGYNILFTWKSPSCKQDSYWTHVDPTGRTDIIPEPDKIVRIPDPVGWHCKTGYYGKTNFDTVSGTATSDEPDRVLWHAAYGGPRITLGYIVYDEDLWLDIIDELGEWDSRNAQEAISSFSGPA